MSKRRHSRNAKTSLIIDVCVFGGLAAGFVTKNIMIFPIVLAALLIISIVCKLVSKASHGKTNKADFKKYANSGIRETDTMSGEDFELFLAAHFKKNGYKVKATPKSKDYGADLIISKGGITTAVQAKRYADKVGIKAIQEIVSAKDYYHTDKTMVVTNNYFTDSAKNLADSCGVELWDRQMLIRTFNLTDFKEFEQTSNYKENMVCPLCKGKLSMKSGKYGSFYGCSNYPTCRYTKNVE